MDNKSSDEPAIFSTRRGTLPARAVPVPPPAVITKSSGFAAIAQFASTLREEYPVECFSMRQRDFREWKLSDYWDELDIHLQGPFFLSHVLNHIAHENVGYIVGFCEQWFLQNVELVPLLCGSVSVEAVFNYEDHLRFGDVFLTDALTHMRWALSELSRCQQRMPNAQSQTVNGVALSNVQQASTSMPSQLPWTSNEQTIPGRTRRASRLSVSYTTGDVERYQAMAHSGATRIFSDAKEHGHHATTEYKARTPYHGHLTVREPHNRALSAITSADEAPETRTLDTPDPVHDPDPNTQRTLTTNLSPPQVLNHYPGHTMGRDGPYFVPLAPKDGHATVDRLTREVEIWDPNTFMRSAPRHSSQHFLLAGHTPPDAFIEKPRRRSTTTGDSDRGGFARDNLQDHRRYPIHNDYRHRPQHTTSWKTQSLLTSELHQGLTVPPVRQSSYTMKHAFPKHSGDAYGPDQLALRFHSHTQSHTTLPSHDSPHPGHEGTTFHRGRRPSFAGSSGRQALAYSQDARNNISSDLPFHQQMHQGSTTFPQTLVKKRTKSFRNGQRLSDVSENRAPVNVNSFNRGSGPASNGIEEQVGETSIGAQRPGIQKLWVGCLSPESDNKAIVDFFAQAAHVPVRLSRGKPGSSWGFITIQSSDDARKALRLNGAVLDGRPIAVRVPHSLITWNSSESKSSAHSNQAYKLQLQDREYHRGIEDFNYAEKGQHETDLRKIRSMSRTSYQRPQLETSFHSIDYDEVVPSDYEENRPVEYREVPISFTTETNQSATLNDYGEVKELDVPNAHDAKVPSGETSDTPGHASKTNEKTPSSSKDPKPATPNLQFNKKAPSTAQVQVGEASVVSVKEAAVSRSPKKSDNLGQKKAASSAAKPAKEQPLKELASTSQMPSDQGTKGVGAAVSFVLDARTSMPVATPGLVVEPVKGIQAPVVTFDAANNPRSVQVSHTSKNDLDRAAIEATKLLHTDVPATSSSSCADAEPVRARESTTSKASNIRATDTMEVRPDRNLVAGTEPVSNASQGVGMTIVDKDDKTAHEAIASDDKVSVLAEQSAPRDDKITDHQKDSKSSLKARKKPSIADTAISLHPFARQKKQKRTPSAASEKKKAAKKQRKASQSKLSKVRLDSTLDESHEVKSDRTESPKRPNHQKTLVEAPERQDIDARRESGLMEPSSNGTRVTTSESDHQNTANDAAKTLERTTPEQPTANSIPENRTEAKVLNKPELSSETLSEPDPVLVPKSESASEGRARRQAESLEYYAARRKKEQDILNLDAQQIEEIIKQYDYKNGITDLQDHQVDDADGVAIAWDDASKQEVAHWCLMRQLERQDFRAPDSGSPNHREMKRELRRQLEEEIEMIEGYARATQTTGDDVAIPSNEDVTAAVSGMEKEKKKEKDEKVLKDDETGAEDLGTAAVDSAVSENGADLAKVAEPTGNGGKGTKKGKKRKAKK